MINKNSLIVLEEMYHFHQFGLPHDVICVCSDECVECSFIKEKCALLLEDTTDGIVNECVAIGSSKTDKGIRLLIGKTVFYCPNLEYFMYEIIECQS